ncbi:ABC-type transport system involved in resistance to organic solvents, periplasmic component [Synechococcus sp. PCC 7502]|uniref:MlaD family protein n=1 Tax=Synechococcus sp. PCC 7502 TaxID=1173263 RepID=UPI00029FADA4|nr:MlaD family protein [Synechococcus sp. PCC 7502]AFY73874.1 ABC-type transport system involved in resistance to organic solvents, periplasmic component [Synechococcus sp. PCC 7502]
MQAKTLREGSLGILILVGIGVFGAIVLWLKGFRLGETGFTFAIKFPDASGLDVGSAVRFRGVQVGKVQSLNVQNDGAVVTVAISNPNLIIPRQSIIETTQSGFLSSTVIDILPQSDLMANSSNNPLSEKCNNQIVVCSGKSIDGAVGVSFTRLLRQTSAALRQVNDSKLIETLSSTLKSTTEAAKSIKKLSDRVTTVASGVDKQLDRFGETAGQISNAAVSVGKTANTAENFLTSNRENLASTLQSISNTSKEAQALLASAKPLLANGEFIENLKKLSESAAETANNLRIASKEINNPETIASLRATLDAARITFANAQKISSDLDELTGDPKFRSNIRTLINGLTGLVSSGSTLGTTLEFAAQKTTPNKSDAEKLVTPEQLRDKKIAAETKSDK